MKAQMHAKYAEVLVCAVATRGSPDLPHLSGTLFESTAFA
jgi:hypothetical protein